MMVFLCTVCKTESKTMNFTFWTIWTPNSLTRFYNNYMITDYELLDIFTTGYPYYYRNVLKKAIHYVRVKCLRIPVEEMINAAI